MIMQVGIDVYCSKGTYSVIEFHCRVEHLGTDVLLHYMLERQN